MSVARQRKTRNRGARFNTGRSGTTTITHREFVKDISGVADFGLNTFRINPGDSTTFPWLSTIATRYESYVFKRLQFQYETVSSSITPGSLMMACDYDASDKAPSSKVGLMSYAGATRSAPWQACTYSATTAELTKFAKQRYVRGAAAITGDVKTYDVANLFIATQGIGTVTAAAAAAGALTPAVGELYVDYAVELQTPQSGLTATPTPGDLSAIWRNDSPWGYSASETVFFDPMVQGQEPGVNTQTLPNVTFANGLLKLTDKTKSYYVGMNILSDGVQQAVPHTFEFFVDELLQATATFNLEQTGKWYDFGDIVPASGVDVTIGIKAAGEPITTDERFLIVFEVDPVEVAAMGGSFSPQAYLARRSARL